MPHSLPASQCNQGAIPNMNRCPGLATSLFCYSVASFPCGQHPSHHPGRTPCTGHYTLLARTQMYPHLRPQRGTQDSQLPGRAQKPPRRSELLKTALRFFTLEVTALQVCSAASHRAGCSCFGQGSLAVPRHVVSRSGLLTDTSLPSCSHPHY